MKILIIKPSSLGDIVHVFPAVDILLEAYPDAVIDWLVHPAFVGMVKYCRNFRRAIIFPRRELGRAATFLPYFTRLARKLRREKYDLVVDFQGLLRSALFGRMTRCRRYVGFGHPREFPARFLYRENFAAPPEFVHAVDRNCYLAGRIVNRPYRSGTPAVLPVNPVNAARAEVRLRQAGIGGGERFLGVIPGARWESKQWPPEFFASVISRLAAGDPQLKFVLLGSPSDVAGADAVRAAATCPDRIVSLVGATRISDLVEIIRQSSGLLTNDSGPMHIAAALKVPVFAVFGPTVPEKTGPYGNIHTVWQPELPCRQCLKRYCPTGGSRCHQSIDPEQVANEIRGKLSGVYQHESKK